MIEYKYCIDDVLPKQLSGFFIDWPDPPDRETHYKILKNSSYIVLAIDTETNNLIGFINAISDSILCSYIPLLEVLPSYQGKGIGNELVKRMMDQLQNLYMIDIVCDENLKSFYNRHGFNVYSCIIKRNYTKQSGKTDVISV